MTRLELLAEIVRLNEVIVDKDLKILQLEELIREFLEIIENTV